MGSERDRSNEDDLSEASPPDSDVASGDGRVYIDPTILELDHAFSALSHPRRRYRMYALAENPERSLDDLATKLVAHEEGVDEATVDAYRRDQVYVSLYHTHIPELVDDVIITFNNEDGTIAQAGHAEHVFAVLSGVGGSHDHTQVQHANRTYDNDSKTDS